MEQRRKDVFAVGQASVYSQGIDESASDHSRRADGHLCLDGIPAATGDRRVFLRPGRGGRGLQQPRTADWRGSLRRYRGDQTAAELFAVCRFV